VFGIRITFEEKRSDLLRRVLTGPFVESDELRILVRIPVSICIRWCTVRSVLAALLRIVDSEDTYWDWVLAV
jgi:hypothetical protein